MNIGTGSGADTGKMDHEKWRAQDSGGGRRGICLMEMAKQSLRAGFEHPPDVRREMKMMRYMKAFLQPIQYIAPCRTPHQSSLHWHSYAQAIHSLRLFTGQIGVNCGMAWLLAWLDWFDVECSLSMSSNIMIMISAMLV